MELLERFLVKTIFPILKRKKNLTDCDGNRVFSKSKHSQMANV